MNVVAPQMSILPLDMLKLKCKQCWRNTLTWIRCFHAIISSPAVAPAENRVSAPHPGSLAVFTAANHELGALGTVCHSAYTSCKGQVFWY